jgi:coenzyme F430 synthetase
MKVLIVDMTHGGAWIASEFMKIPDIEVFAWDIYSTMDAPTMDELRGKGLKFIESLDGLRKLKNQPPESDLMIVAPVHCKVESEVHMTHHEAVGFLLRDKIDIPVIEVTGVKGKTSVVWMLKEIFKDLNPLVLSSLGVEVLDDGEWKVLKKDISITPASIIEALKLAKEYEIGICIFETSLGGTGLADVGILTNLAEDYPIADNSMVASNAKLQIFKSSVVSCEIDSFNSNYSEFIDKTNTFDCGANQVNIKNQANLSASQIRFGFDKTNLKIDIVDLKTSGHNILNESIEVSTFAPAPMHINNVLAAVCASLTLDVPSEKIIQGLNNFTGVKGRTSITEYNGIRVIEEINPGLNVTAVKKALLMMKDMDNVGVIFGGKYGVTCEEIDEESVSSVLDEIKDDLPLILVDELGASVKNIIKRNFTYCNDLDSAMECAIDNTCSNILLIYRSNFSDIKKR